MHQASFVTTLISSAIPDNFSLLALISTQIDRWRKQVNITRIERTLAQIPTHIFLHACGMFSRRAIFFPPSFPGEKHQILFYRQRCRSFIFKSIRQRLRLLSIGSPLTLWRSKRVEIGLNLQRRLEALPLATDKIVEGPRDPFPTKLCWNFCRPFRLFLDELIKRDRAIGKREVKPFTVKHCS